MRIFYAALLLILLLAILVFCIQNMAAVPVSFMGWGINVSLSVLVLLVYLLGMATGWSVLSLLRRSIHGVRKKHE